MGDKAIRLKKNQQSPEADSRFYLVSRETKENKRDNLLATLLGKGGEQNRGIENSLTRKHRPGEETRCTTITNAVHWWRGKKTTKRRGRGKVERKVRATGRQSQWGVES